MPKEFWNCFQLFLGQSKLPFFFVEILKISVYDSPISIELLDREKLGEIEQFIDTNFGCANDLLKNTVYENKEVFRFLPGHITLLLGLKTYAQKFIETGFKKRKNSKQQDREFIRDPSDELDAISEEVEIPSTDDLNKLKEALITKITNFCRKQNITVDKISNDCVKDDLQVIINTNGDQVFKCIFVCHCEVKIPCIHNKYWQISNIERHLKIHKTHKPTAAVNEQLTKILQTNFQSNP